MIGRCVSAAPSLAVNLYADDAPADPHEMFARIRAAGPVVWLPRHRRRAAPH